MNHLFTNHFTWPDLIATAIVLAILYMVIKTLAGLLERTALPERIRSHLCNGLRWATLFFEPAAALILLVIFIFIRPYMHGAVVALMLIGGFSHLRHYLSGFIMKLYKSVELGNRLRTSTTEGVITHIGRLGLHMRTADGQHFSNYSKLLKEGYTLVTGKEAGGFFQLNISWEKKEGTQSKNYIFHQLYDLLAQAPYISPKHKPDITPVPNKEGQFTAKILVEEEHHLFEMMALLEERGWQVERKPDGRPGQ